MQDTYNLTWKLALVLKGHAHPTILDAHDLERKHIAEQLIEFDKKIAGMFASRKDLNSPELHDLWEEPHDLTSDIEHQYPPNLVVNDKVAATMNSKLYSMHTWQDTSRYESHTTHQRLAC